MTPLDTATTADICLHCGVVKVFLHTGDPFCSACTSTTTFASTASNLTAGDYHPPLNRAQRRADLSMRRKRWRQLAKAMRQ